MESNKLIVHLEKTIGAEDEDVDVEQSSSSIVSAVPTTVIRQTTDPMIAGDRKRRHGSGGGEEDNESEDGALSSRKQKSLGLLCQRFLTAMGEESRKGNEIHLETVAKKMAVEKRRIYDIVNVMEALEAMAKTNKSFYQWHGLAALPRLMAHLQKEAMDESLPDRILKVEQAMCSFTELSARRSSAETVGTLVGSKAEDSGFYGSDENLQKSTGIIDRNRSARDRNGRNSLAQLCRRFLMVLLSNPQSKRKVSLDVASTVLIKDPDTEGFEPPSRSRCRRLYDIANVLVAMGLIRKVHYLFGTKKIPLFVYSGPEPDLNGRLDSQECLALLANLSHEVGEDTAAKKMLAMANHRSSPMLPMAPTEPPVKMPRKRSLMDLAQVTERERIKLVSVDLPKLVAERQQPDENAPPEPLQPPILSSPFTPFNAGVRRFVPAKMTEQYRMPPVQPAYHQLQPTNRLWQLAAEQSRLHNAAVNRILMASNVATAAAVGSSPPTAVSVSHSVTSILASSNRLNIAANQFSHYRIGSPFQLVQPNTNTAIVNGKTRTLSQAELMR